MCGDEAHCVQSQSTSYCTCRRGFQKVPDKNFCQGTSRCCWRGLGIGRWGLALVRCDFAAGVGFGRQERCPRGRVGVRGAPSGSPPDPTSRCPDINECLRFGTCSQLCNNTKGSHVCSCAKNFMKTDNMCKAEGQEGAGTHTGSVCAQDPPACPGDSCALPSIPLPVLSVCPSWTERAPRRWRAPSDPVPVPPESWAEPPRSWLSPHSQRSPHSWLSPCSS